MRTGQTDNRMVKQMKSDKKTKQKSHSPPLKRIAFTILKTDRITG